MSQIEIAVIVEGHGECEAVPILVRRIAQEIASDFVPRVLPPFRVPASRLIKRGEIERTVEFAGRKLQGQGGIVVILDCDWSGCCPAKEGPRLLARARVARSDIPITVILAKKEFEAWFIAAAESLRGKRGLAMDLRCPPHPENIRGAKEWLSKKMTTGAGYSETDDQPAFVHEFDMAAAALKADSFDKCYREIRTMLEGLRRARLTEGARQRKASPQKSSRRNSP